MFSKDILKKWVPLKECIEKIGLKNITTENSHKGKSIERPVRASINGQVIVHGTEELLLGVGVNFSYTGVFIETDRKLFNVGDEIEKTCKVEGLFSSL